MRCDLKSVLMVWPGDGVTLENIYLQVSTSVLRCAADKVALIIVANETYQVERIGS